MRHRSVNDADALETLAATEQQVVDVSIAAPQPNELAEALQDLDVDLTTPDNLFVVSRVPGDDYERLTLIQDDGTRLLLPFTCSRAHVGGGVLMCMSPRDSVVPTWEAVAYDLTDPELGELMRRPAALPSRARVDPSGQFVAYTEFVSGHDYTSAGEFSTRTVVYGLDDDDLFISDSGERWRRSLPGQRSQLLGCLYSEATNEAEPLNLEGSCPSVSPDGRFIVYKRADFDRAVLGEESNIRLVLHDTDTGQERLLGETRFVDDQVEWLDEDTIVYAIKRDDEESIQPAYDVCAADGGVDVTNLAFGNTVGTPAAATARAVEKQRLQPVERIGEAAGGAVVVFVRLPKRSHSVGGRLGEQRKQPVRSRRLAFGLAFTRRLVVHKDVACVDLHDVVHQHHLHRAHHVDVIGGVTGENHRHHGKMPRARLDRLESLDAIRQLVAKYALSLDMRDLDAHVNLFAPDIRVSREHTGRAHLKRWLDDTLRLQFTGTAHHIGNHVIEFDDADHAHGVVYSKNEHETGDQWVIMQMHYERMDGVWLFRRRLPCYWYATDLNKPPIGEAKMRWPDREPYEGAYHQLFPSWEHFWQHPPGPEEPEVAAPAPLEEFLSTMRRGSADPKIRVR
ncbi:hypothetical protein GQR58_030576 [Nymphon striatum]|nr:hypothetical protein GQR58_030576 [Nymphon striatum]